MKLQYPDNAKSTDRSVSLLRSGQRVELWLLPNEDLTYSMVGISGTDEALPAKQKLQGPYHTRAQAIAARTAITQALENSGFHIDNGEPIWSLAAQKLIREIRSSRIASQGNYEFSPDDVL